ncbi:MAG: hypothetical protein PHR77_11710 [Kiritimatiellae bacterium]|nr:hypothetical protein [Kiritimatiellia bacterium]MDD5521882.1 hypothetical protein [Kiritimatiellia bacterium]
MSFPRILLLTPAPPDCPYSGGVLRKIVNALPENKISWAYLSKGTSSGVKGLVQEGCFPHLQIHWRLNRSFIYGLLHQEVFARLLAKRITVWSSEFKPEVLWVHAGGGTVHVANFLQKRLNIPMHLTFFDAPEVCMGHFCQFSRWYIPLYVNKVAQLTRRAKGLDAVSLELVKHVEKLSGITDSTSSMVFSSSISGKVVTSLPVSRSFDEKASVRRIGFCGSLRIAGVQWRDFIELLGQLPFKFEILLFADKGFMFNISPPHNVTIIPQKYVDTEENLIRRMVDMQIHAGYLGLWKADEMSLFCRTSLSSKLTTYAAAGLPVIVDGPEDSVAWRLVKEYGAGVLCGSSGISALKELFGNSKQWERKSFASRAMWDHEFNLEKNVEKFRNHFYDILSTEGMNYE